MVGVTRIARDVVACSNQFSEAVLLGVMTEKVREEIESMSFKTSGSVNSWSNWDQ